MIIEEHEFRVLGTYYYIKKYCRGKQLYKRVKEIQKKYGMSDEEIDRIAEICYKILSGDGYEDKMQKLRVRNTED